MEGKDLTRRPVVRVLLVAALALLSTGSAAPGPREKKRPNDPTTCPWCHNDPKVMQAAGIVNHGGFDFGKYDTQKADDLLATCDIRWIESAHFRIGFALGSHKVKLEEKKKIIAELTRLQQFLPEIKPETAILDPWLRAHLYAQRSEDVWQRFTMIMQIGDMKFADGSGVWRGTYMGEGPYLGMKQKYEILVVPTQATHTYFLTENCGLQIKNSQRWHYVQRGAITINCHTEQGNLRQDPALHGHIAFNLAHNLFDGLNHYSYDTPIWIHEGLAHVMEREIDPRNNSFDGGEGAVPDMTSKSDWKPEVLKLIASGEAPRMAELVALKSYSELKLPHHYVTWSMVDYLLKTRPEDFAKFVWAIKNCKDERGVPTGANLPEWHRKQFKEILGWNYPEFDEVWRAWAQGAYKPTTPKGGDPNGPAIPLPGSGPR